MKVTKKEVQRFKELDEKFKSGKASPDEVKELKRLSSIILKNRERKSPGTNDIDWYSKFPDLVRDAANIVFNEIAGSEFRVEFPATSSAQWPAVGCRFEVLPTIGKSKDANAAYNYQMRNLWLQMHRAFRGLGSYEYPDLGIAIFSIIAAFADLVRAERVYGVYNKFIARNRSYPKTILQALGLDPADVDTLATGTDLADFRYRLNRLIAKAKLLCLPKGLSIWSQYVNLFGNVFKDSDNVRAQWFVYDNPFLLKYDPTFTTGGRITYTARRRSGSTNAGQTLNDIVEDLNDQFDALLSDTDIARMCSDMLKAFGDNGVQILEPLPENFIIEPINDEIRRLQLHNTTLVGTLAGGNFSSTIMTALGTLSTSSETLMVYQEDGFMHHSLFSVDPSGAMSIAASQITYVGTDNVPSTTTPKFQFMTGNPMLDIWKDDVGPSDVVEMTRQTVALNYENRGTLSQPKNVFELDAFSTYVVTKWIVYTAYDLGSNVHYETASYGTNLYSFASASGAMLAFAGFSYVSQMDWHPYLALGYSNAGAAPTLWGVYYDMDNYSLIPKLALSRIHDACTMSLFKLELVAQSTDK